MVYFTLLRPMNTLFKMADERSRLGILTLLGYQARRQGGS